MNTPQPFKDEDILYRFTTTEEEREKNWLAHEYAVVKDAYGHAGLTVYYSIGKEWRNDSWAQFSIIIARLLRERDALTTERDIYRAALEKYEDTMKWRYRILDGWETDDLIVWAGDNNGRDTAVAALEQGDKIRGET